PTSAPQTSKPEPDELAARVPSGRSKTAAIRKSWSPVVSLVVYHQPKLLLARVSPSSKSSITISCVAPPSPLEVVPALASLLDASGAAPSEVAAWSAKFSRSPSKQALARMLALIIHNRRRMARHPTSLARTGSAMVYPGSPARSLEPAHAIEAA